MLTVMLVFLLFLSWPRPWTGRHMNRNLMCWLYFIKYNNFIYCMFLFFWVFYCSSQTYNMTRLFISPPCSQDFCVNNESWSHVALVKRLLVEITCYYGVIHSRKYTRDHREIMMILIRKTWMTLKGGNSLCFPQSLFISEPHFLLKWITMTHLLQASATNPAAIANTVPMSQKPPNA